MRYDKKINNKKQITIAKDKERNDQIMSKHKASKFNMTTLDLRTVECPMNLVKTKLALEELDKNDILEVFLDPGEAIQSVPPAIEEDGHEISVIKNFGTYFSVIIKK